MLGLTPFFLVLAVHVGHAAEDADRGHALCVEAKAKSEEGDLAGARGPYEEGLGLLDAQLGPEHLDVEVCLTDLAMVTYRLGDFAAARPLFERILRIGESRLGPEHPDVLSRINNLAAMDEALGDYKSASELLERAVFLLEKLNGPDHIDLALPMQNLASIRHRLGDYPGANALMGRALAIAESSAGPDSEIVGSISNNLGLMAQQQGDHKTARMHYERALRIRQDVHGPNDSKVAVTLGNLATVLSSHGDNARAVELLKRALHIKENAHGPDHPWVGETLIQLGLATIGQRKYDAAAPLFERALTILESTVGPDHPHVAYCLSSLAASRKALGDHTTALAHYERAVAMLEAAHGPNHLALAAPVHNMAYLLREIERYEDAERAYERSLAIAKRHLIDEHPSVATALIGLAWIVDREGDAEKARGMRRQALDTSTTYITDLIAGLSEREALAAVAKSREFLDAFVTHFDRPDDARATWTATLRWKGATARAVTARRRVVSQDPKALEIAAQLADTRRSLSNLVLARSRVEPAERREQIVELREMQERLERDLAAADPSQDTGGYSATPEEVCAAVPPDSALVDFLTHDNELDRERKVVAFVVSPSCEVRRIDLGPEAHIAGLIASHREALVSRDARGDPNSSRRIDDRGRRLHDEIWSPLAEAIGDARRVLIAPDGPLTGVSFGALPVEDGYLLERIQISYLESATDLVRWTVPSTATSGLLLIGGVEYGEGPGAACLEASFGPLPGTASEIDAIASSWRKREGEVLRLSGRGADEATVALSMPGQRVIHIASHGFFGTGKCDSQLTDGVGFDPMVLSGVVLAGANEEPGSLETADGILTAAEVSGLDLAGTELVVLSACETGLGEVKSGEGVLGLRRAFAASGARTLVMSLWSVPDRSTATLMAHFYQSILRRRGPLPPGEALRLAQVKMLNHNRAIDGDGRPSDWAAFITAGDWR